MKSASKFTVNLAVILILIFVVSNIAHGEVYKADPKVGDQGGGAIGGIKNILDTVGTLKQATIILSNSSTGNTTNYVIATPLTIGNNVQIIIERGAVVNASAHIRINGTLEAGLYKVFNLVGRGKVTFGHSSVKCVPWQWFGAFPDGVTDYSTEIQQAVDAAGSMIPSLVTTGTWVMSSPLMLKTGYAVLGEGNNSTIIKNNKSDGMKMSPGETSSQYVRVSDIMFRGERTVTNTQTGFDMSGFRDSVFRNLTFQYFETGIKAHRENSALPCYFNSIENVLCLDNRVGVDFKTTNTANANTFYNLNVQGTEGIFKGTTGIRVAGAGNVFSGKTRVGGGDIATSVYFQKISRSNQFQFLYLESNPQTGIYCEDLSNRTNFIYGLHFDGTPQTKINDPKDQLTFITSDRMQLAGPVDADGNVGLRISSSRTYGGAVNSRTWEIAGGQSKSISNPLAPGNLGFKNVTKGTIPFEIDKNAANDALKINATGINIGAGSNISKHWSVSVKPVFGIIASQSAVQVAVNVMGVASGDSVTASPIGDIGNGLLWACWAAKETVYIRLANPTKSNVMPTNGVWKIDVWKH